METKYFMENYIKDLSSQLKTYNDAKSQIKIITLLNNVHEDLKKYEKVRYLFNERKKLWSIKCKLRKLYTV